MISLLQFTADFTNVKSVYQNREENKTKIEFGFHQSGLWSIFNVTTAIAALATFIEYHSRYAVAHFPDIHTDHPSQIKSLNYGRNSRDYREHQFQS